MRGCLTRSLARLSAVAAVRFGLWKGGVLVADAPEGLVGADVDAAVGDGWGSIDGAIELARGDLFELWPRFECDEVALLAAAEDLAISGDRAAEELAAAGGAVDALFIDGGAGFEIDGLEDAAIAEEIHDVADHEGR